MNHVFVLHHSYELDGVDEAKLIGVYSTEDRARAAITRLSVQPGFAEHAEGFHLDRYEIDKDHWTDGFATAVCVEVPLRETDQTVTAHATRLSSGEYKLWPEPNRSTEQWTFQPEQTVRCELRRSQDGVERWVAVELISE